MEDLINIQLTRRDIEHLYTTSMVSFYHKQSERFEREKGNIKDIGKDGYGTFLWYGNNQLEALICFHYYSQKYKCVLLWDTVENPICGWCLYVHMDLWSSRLKLSIPWKNL